MNLKGSIKTVNYIKVGGKECYGMAKTDKRHFVIKIDKQIMQKDPMLFLKVLLHEILHLYLAIVDSYTQNKFKLSESAQHKIMNPPIKLLISGILNRIKQINIKRLN